MAHLERVDRRIVKSKALLKEALLSLMQENHFRDITIMKIVEKADLNRGTFYKNYQYKEDILDEIIEDVTTDLIASFRAPYQQQQVLIVNSLQASAIKIFDHVARHSLFYKLLAQGEAFPGFQKKLCQLFKVLLLQDFADITNNSQINRELLASYRAYASLGVMMDWVEGGFTYSTTYMAEQLVAILQSSHENYTYQVLSS
ncbi:TetR/AcrR family transcriptional regulator [Gorillibacterium timonense]|uniref:TetR/AcrR family transcriptional regulator n=1 Tax=Gorillibacterium timonense TaxID=1689269 RepID=UPI00071DDDA6|nr:TetR-like C-terminal domain-containing protein [Gorillibacterium timonense]